MRFIKTIFLFAVLLTGAAAYAQDTDFISKMSEIDKKPTATYGDAVMLFKAQTGNDISLGYKDDAPLTKGMVALMTARYLNLKGSLMYNLTGFERYAFTACVADGIMRADGSENDLMSGTELIEVLAKISAKAGE